MLQKFCRALPWFLFFGLVNVCVSQKLRRWTGPDVLVRGTSPMGRINGKVLAQLNGYCYVFGGDSSDGA